MNKLARPNAIHTLNGVVPFWKPMHINENELFQKSYRLLLRDLGAPFKFAKSWTVKSVARLPDYSSGVSLLALGIGCRVTEGNLLHNRLNASYRAVIKLNSETLNTNISTLDAFNNFLNRFNGRLLLNQLKICNFDESIGIEKPLLDPQRFKNPFEFTVDSIHCAQIQNSEAVLNVACKPTFLIPHLLGNIETELNCGITLKDLCRIKLGPFQHSDCLNLGDENGFTFEIIKQKLKQIKIMNANLIEDFYTNEEWRNIGS